MTLPEYKLMSQDIKGAESLLSAAYTPALTDICDVTGSSRHTLIHRGRCV